MASLTELTQWEASIYQLETTDPVKGGNDGISNLQGKQLANRTAYLKQQVELKAPLASPTFTGIPNAPTAPPGTNTTQLANTSFVATAIANLIASSPAALDTLNELATALGNDPNFATTMTNLLAGKVSISELQKCIHSFAVDSGVANAYVVNLTPALVAPRGEGQVIRFKVLNANTGASTINDGLGVVPLVGGGALAALQGGEMAPGGDAWVQWNSTVGTGSYVLLSCSGSPKQTANGTKSQHAVTLQQLTSVVGAVRNLRMTNSGSSSSATFTADELIVETALGGLKYQVSNLSKTINLATTGAGGMDTGSVPTSGYVAIYAILNPTTGATALLGYNATSASAANIYPGSNMPSGYTASALISVLPTNSSGIFKPVIQRDRNVFIQQTSVLSTTSVSTSLISLSLSGAVPPNATSINGIINMYSTSGTGAMLIAVADTAAGFCPSNLGGYANAVNAGIYGNFYGLNLTTAQTMFYNGTMCGPTAYSVNISITGYSF